MTYDSKPLYYYTPDTTIGDTKGQGAGGNWFVVLAAASGPAAPAAPAPADAPATLPRTGGASTSTVWLVALALLLIALGAVLAGTRRSRGI